VYELHVENYLLDRVERWRNYYELFQIFKRAYYDIRCETFDEPVLDFTSKRMELLEALDEIEPQIKKVREILDLAQQEYFNYKE